MWWLHRRRDLINNVAKLVASAESSAERLIEWMRVDAALIRHALKNGGDAELTVPNDEIRILLAEQLAAILMARENLMLLQALIWPDQPYPRWDCLTPEQRYFCFGPDDERRFGKSKVGQT